MLREFNFLRKLGKLQQLKPPNDPLLDSASSDFCSHADHWLMYRRGVVRVSISRTQDLRQPAVRAEEGK